MAICRLCYNEHRMKQKFAQGFTIIEVSFFLTISGLMAVGLLAGMGATINSHRYRDSVMSLQSQLQQEFSRVENIENDRSGNESCTASANISTIISSYRGTTDCVIIGRYIAVEGDKITSYPVIARPTSSTNNSLDDIAYLKSHTIKIDQLYSLDEGRKWGNTITYSADFGTRKGDTRNVYFLMVRSPKSGSIYSFSSGTNLKNNSSGLSQMVIDTPAGENFGRSRQILCVKKEGAVSMSNLGVSLEANLANSNGIQVLSNDTEAKC